MEVRLGRMTQVYRRGDRQIVIILGSKGELQAHAPGQDGGALYVPNREDAEDASLPLVEWRVRSVDRGPNHVAYMVLNPVGHDHGATVMVRGNLLTFMGDEYERDVDFQYGVSIEVIPFVR
jgi:hypothetical protein